MPYYIPNLVSKTSCLGNSLSTFNTSFTALDTNLYNLSTYTYTGVNYLSTKLVSVSSTLTNSINYLSSKMVSVSGELDTAVYNTSSYLMEEVTTLSGYTTAFDLSLLNTLYTISSDSSTYIERIDWYTTDVGDQNIILDMSEHMNFGIILYVNDAVITNPVSAFAGQSGNIKLATYNRTVSSFGSMWTFSNNYSAVTRGTNLVPVTNIISYYYDGYRFLASMANF